LVRSLLILRQHVDMIPLFLLFSFNCAQFIITWLEKNVMIAQFFSGA
jgi:hypothetical protein